MSIELKVPALGESISEAIVAKWLKAVGDSVTIDEPLVELETDKVTVSLPAPAAGVISEQRAQVGAKVSVGATIGLLTPGAVTASAKAAEKPAVATAAAPAPSPAPAANGAASNGARAAAAPPAPAAAASSAPTDRLSPSERWALREGAAATPRHAPAPISFGPVPVSSADEEVVKMTPLRQKIAERLVAAQHTAAILTTFNECDMTNIMALRAKHGEEFQKRHGVKLGFMSFFAKAVVESLKDWPSVNAEVRGEHVIYKKRYHLGVAVGSGKGLVVPVVRDADRLSFGDLEKTIADFGVRARDNKLTLPELQGGTFTISNGGIYGSMMSTPLLNMPQTGILGMHNIIKRPIAVGDEVQIRPMMYLALSYDHRLVDGREAVSFLVGVKNRIEQPERLLFGV